MIRHFIYLSLCLLPAFAQAQSPELDSNKPIEITADQLEVLQEEQQAIFSGNVIAKQGGITMQSGRMLVYYSNAGQNDKVEEKGMMGAANGISRIVADGGVFFTSAMETAKGARAVYDVSQEQISMTGDVTLTREQNILKGTQLTYNLKTGKSVLSAAALQGTTSGGRVRGLFVPNQNK